jgi:hypothetical protein
MAHEFKVKVDGSILTYENFDDIPDNVTEIIHFNPDQTGLSDDEIVEWSGKYKELQDKVEGNQ